MAASRSPRASFSVSGRRVDADEQAGQMKNYIVLLSLLALTLTAAAKVTAVPLLALPLARDGFKNMLWMEERTKLGGESVATYIQGTGGSDDAIMGLKFDQKWDMFTATVGFKSTTPAGKTAEFFVEAGGQILYSSGPIESRGEAHVIKVPIRGYERITLRISPDRYNGTAGAAFGQPTLLHGLSEADMQVDWSVKVDGRKAPLPGNGAPREVLVPVKVPASGEKTYQVKVTRDEAGRTVIVEQSEL